LLKFKSNLVYSPCHHGKMIDASHSSVNTMITEQPNSYSIWTLSVLLRFAPYEESGMFLSSLMTFLITLGFFLESKDEVFEHFWSLALRLSNEHPNFLKVIRSDNGTEFRNTSFDQFCLEHGVDQQFSAPCVPQQNGVVK
jgi:hypothetical protein